jgi:ubiquitin C-terminal hydrolase
VEIHSSVKLARSWSNNGSNSDDPLSMITLEDCLQSFINWENLDNKEMFNCKRCKQLQPADKKLDIWKLPPCLVRELYILKSNRSPGVLKRLSKRQFE